MNVHSGHSKLSSYRVVDINWINELLRKCLPQLFTITFENFLLWQLKILSRNPKCQCFLFKISSLAMAVQRKIKNVNSPFLVAIVTILVEHLLVSGWDESAELLGRTDSMQQTVAVGRYQNSTQFKLSLKTSFSCYTWQHLILCIKDIIMDTTLGQKVLEGILVL